MKVLLKCLKNKQKMASRILQKTGTGAEQKMSKVEHAD